MSSFLKRHFFTNDPRTCKLGYMVFHVLLYDTMETTENCRDLETCEPQLSDSVFLQFCRLIVRKHETWTLMCLLFSTGQCLSCVSDSAQKARARI